MFWAPRLGALLAITQFRSPSAQYCYALGGRLCPKISTTTPLLLSSLFPERTSRDWSLDRLLSAMMGVSRLSSIKSPLSELFIYLDEIYTYVRSSLCLPSLGFWPLAAGMSLFYAIWSQIGPSVAPNHVIFTLLYKYRADKPSEDPAYLMPVAEGYTSKRSHLIDLETLSWSDSLLTKTLSHMREVRQDYAVASEVPYQTAFNWDDLFKTLQNLAEQEGCTWPEQRRYHIIAFYSQLHPEMGAATDSNNLLYRLDEAAFEEAMQNGGLLKYWFGKPDEKHRNLATCK